jgi:beta-lactamase superfamily II metal-dependent hydrolase
MANNTVARRVLFPSDPKILCRVAFLYVGQGASAVVFMKAPVGYKILVVDINLDRKRGGIDVPTLMKELLGQGEEVEAFVNTHPHSDHLCGTTALDEAVTIKNVWHSGHIPGADDAPKYEELKKLIKKVKKNGGEERILEGSRDSSPIGLAEHHVLAPAAYVTDDVNDETPETRRSRIHEQCAVIKFGKDPHWIMIVGDADKCAFKEHITKYHNDRLPSLVLAASHHGSRTFFKENEEDDPYKDALEKINPEYVVVSAPEDSPHEHPHDDAMELYREHCGKDGVLYMGENGQNYSYITDVYEDGYSGVNDDQGELAETYGFTDDEDDDGGKQESSKASIVVGAASYARTRVDDRPMGN